MFDEETVFPAWFYGPNEGDADIFNAAADVPKGWSRYQGKAAKLLSPKEEAVDAIEETGDNTPKRRGRPPKVAEVTEDEF